MESCTSISATSTSVKAQNGITLCYVMSALCCIILYSLHLSIYLFAYHYLYLHCRLIHFNPLYSIPRFFKPGPAHLDTCEFVIESYGDPSLVLRYTGFIDRGQRIESRYKTALHCTSS